MNFLSTDYARKLVDEGVLKIAARRFAPALDNNQLIAMCNIFSFIGSNADVSNYVDISNKLLFLKTSKNVGEAANHTIDVLCKYKAFSDVFK